MAFMASTAIIILLFLAYVKRIDCAIPMGEKYPGAAGLAAVQVAEGRGELHPGQELGWGRTQSHGAS